MGCTSSGAASANTADGAVSERRRGEAKGAARADPVTKEIPLGDGSTLSVGFASDSLAYCLLAAHGDATVFLDAQPRQAFDRAHVYGAWCLDEAIAGGSSSSSSKVPVGGETAQEAALRARCSLRSVIVYSGSLSPQGDERVKAILRLLQKVNARPQGQIMLLRGGLSGFSRRFAFCTCRKGGEKEQSLPALPAEVLAPDWGGSRPPALYLGTERSVQDQTTLSKLRIGVIINLSGKPAPKTSCKVLEVKVAQSSGDAADDPIARAREACAKLGRQSAPCMLYGPESALAAALFLVEVLPKAVNAKDAAISLIKQRYPVVELDSLVAQRLLATAAGLSVESSEAADGPGGPRVAASPAPPPPHAIAPAAGLRPASRPPNGNVSRAGNGTAARESAAAAEAFARFQKRDPKGSVVALKTLQAVFGHVLEKPTEEKYRRLKGSNARVKSEITMHPEALQILRLAGFSPVGEDLVLAEHAPLQVIRDVLLGLDRCQPTRGAPRRSV